MQAMVVYSNHLQLASDCVRLYTLSDSVHPRSHCPISFSLDLIGDRWTLLILRDVIIVGKKYFHEMADSPEAIASNILASRLKLLETHDILTGRKDPQNARRRIYEVTTKGLELVPLMLEMIRWGAKHDPLTAAPKSFIQRLDKDRDSVIAEIVAKHGPRSKAKRKGSTTAKE